MVKHPEIRLEQIQHLPFKTFIQVLTDDYYQQVFESINCLEDHIRSLSETIEIEFLLSLHHKIYCQFDELYRKEKLVLFPYLIQLEEENKKAERCQVFKNTAQHYQAVMQHIQEAQTIVDQVFVNTDNDVNIRELYDQLAALHKVLWEIQHIKEQNYFIRFKSCPGCTHTHESHR